MARKNVSVEKLAEEYGTPLYIYDNNEIKKNFQRLSYALTDHADIFYSIKANPNLSICAYLKLLGARAEVCSLFELETAMRAGFSSHDIIFVGPAKSTAEIKRAVELQLYAIVCESLFEIERVKNIAIDLQLTANVALRINPKFALDSALLKMGGKSSQFGISDDHLPTSINEVLNKWIHFRGIHVYNGTRVLNSQDIIKNTEAVVNLAIRLAQSWNVIFDMVDMGGGFGVPYYEKEKSLDLVLLKKGMTEILSRFKNFFPKTRLIFESGRYLVAESGTFVIQVLDIKDSYGEKYAMVDGGINCHMAAMGIHSIIKRNFPIYALPSARRSQAMERYHISGPLCTPEDLIGKNVCLPKLNRGDFIAIKMSGAYGPSASPTYFLSHGYPAEVMLYEGQDYLIRQRDNLENLLMNQRLVDFVVSGSQSP